LAWKVKASAIGVRLYIVDVGRHERTDHMAYKALRDAQRMAAYYGEEFTSNLESWKSDHYVAMRCRDFEERLAVFNGLLLLPLKFKESYDSITVEDPFDFEAETEDIDRRIEEAFLRLSGLSRRIEHGIKQLESQGYEVENSIEFRKLCHQIDEILREARRIEKIEGPMGFRGVEVSPSASATFRALLGGSAAPPSTLQPK
jgi:hypothetical protein